MVVVGSMNLDVTVQVAHIPRPGQTVLASGLRRGPGGKGANQAVAAARCAGAPVVMVAAVGADPDGVLLVDRLQAEGVDTTAVTVLPNEVSGTALITVDDVGANTIVVAAGANAALRMTPAAQRTLQQADVVLAQLEVPQATLTAAARARRPGVPFILNAAPAAPLDADLASEVDVLMVNEHEAIEVAGVGDLAAAIEQLAERFPDVVVTLGDQGAVAVHGRRRVQVPAFPVRAVDTVAAGDTFCGVYAAGLAAGQDVEFALRRASAAAALTCTRPGAQESMPTSDEVAALAGSG